MRDPRQYERLSTTTGDDGPGSGPALVSRITEAHGWTVAADETTDGGASF